MIWVKNDQARAVGQGDDGRMKFHIGAADALPVAAAWCSSSGAGDGGAHPRHGRMADQRLRQRGTSIRRRTR